MQLFVSRDGQQYGPYSIDEARAHLAAGSLFPADHAFIEGMANWAPLEEVLAAASQPASSPTPVAPQPAGQVTQATPAAQARPASTTPAKAKKGKGRKSKPKKTDKASTPGLGALLVKYKAILAIVVIIATGLYVYNVLKDDAPDQGEAPSGLNPDNEMEGEMEEGEGKGGGSGGGDPGGLNDPGGAGGLP